MMTTSTPAAVTLIWKGPDEPQPLDGVDEVLEAGKFLTWLDQSYETDGISYRAEVHEAIPEEDEHYLEEGEPVKAARVVRVRSRNPSATESAAITGPGHYQPTTGYRHQTPV